MKRERKVAPVVMVILEMKGRKGIAVLMGLEVILEKKVLWVQGVLKVTLELLA